MDMIYENNYTRLCGTLAYAPAYSTPGAGRYSIPSLLKFADSPAIPIPSTSSSAASCSIGRAVRSGSISPSPASCAPSITAAVRGKSSS